MSIADPGQSMTNNKLDVLRSVDGFEGVLVKNIKISAVQEALFSPARLPAGSCVSLNASEEAELGVSGTKVGYMLFRDSNLPSTGSFNDPTAIADAVDVTYKQGTTKRVLAFACMQGVEFATTEFDSAPTYAAGDPLTAPVYTSGPVGNAGKVTKTGAKVGATPVVGVVSEAALRKPHNIDMLVFYGSWTPPVDLNSTTEPVWS
jgi:hypothetical protein